MTDLDFLCDPLRMYREVTSEIQIDAEPIYVPERSHPDRGFYFYAYRIRIKNTGGTATQLLSRHWIITDGHGNTEHVKGPGVVGDQPILEPGHTYEYMSFCPLPTPTGNMRGSYQMMDENGKQYEVRIPLFFLRHPDSFH